MKFQEIKVTTLDDVLLSERFNQTKTAELLGVNRGTLRGWIRDKKQIIIALEDGKLVPYVADRRNGHWRK